MGAEHNHQDSALCGHWCPAWQSEFARLLRIHRRRIDSMRAEGRHDEATAVDGDIARRGIAALREHYDAPQDTSPRA